MCKIDGTQSCRMRAEESVSKQGHQKRPHTKGQTGPGARKARYVRAEQNNNQNGSRSPIQKNLQNQQHRQQKTGSPQQNSSRGGTPTGSIAHQQNGAHSHQQHSGGSSPRFNKRQGPHNNNNNGGMMKENVATTPSKPARRSPPPAVTPSKALAYAGAKFSDPPSPKVLPKPPTHWFASPNDQIAAISHGLLATSTGSSPSCSAITSVLKNMLNVQA